MDAQVQRSLRVAIRLAATRPRTGRTQSPHDEHGNRRHVDHLIGDRAQQQRACEQEAILVSLDNLLTFPWILERVAQRKLTLHGWYFDLERGELLRFNPDKHCFEAFPA